MYKILKTKRLLIRPINTTDKEFIFKLVNSAGWLQFIGDRNVKNHEDAEKYIQRILDNKKFFYSVFELKEAKQPVGLVTFLNRDNQEYPDIGFAMLPEFEKKGYCFEAVKRYLDEIIREKACNKVWGIVSSENTKSISLLEKLGLTHHYSYIENEREKSVYQINV